MKTIHKKSIKSAGWQDYELVDCGNYRKLERFGSVILDRFEPDAPWKPALNNDLWKQADAMYTMRHTNKTGDWKFFNSQLDEWIIRIDSLQVVLKIAHSRHVGIFPEQLENWYWISKKIENILKPLKILNLFAYTGVATLFCARTGAEVTHVDASRAAVELGKKSQKLSGMEQSSVRWIVDDVTKFVKREIRRGNQYEGIILDPPLFGRGPKGEIWKFDQSIATLLELLNPLFSNRSPFFLLTAYNHQFAEDYLANLIKEKITRCPGEIQYGPLVQIQKSTGKELKQAEYVRLA